MLLVPRLWPSPTRTLDESLRLPHSSVIIIIIVVSRGLIELVWAKYKQGASQSKPLVITAGVVLGLCQSSPPPYPNCFAPPGLIHSSSVRAVPGLSSCTNQDGKPPTFLDTALAWSRAAPGARRKPRGYVWTKSDRFTIMTTKYNNINTADKTRYKVR